MSVENVYFNKLQAAITPIVSIGVGSAIFTVCSRMKLNPSNLTAADLAPLKTELTKFYSQFWADKLADIEGALAKV